MVALAAFAFVIAGTHAAVGSAHPELSRQAIDFLVGRADDSDPDVRIAVIAAWGDIEGPAPQVGELLKKAGQDRDDFVRLEAGYSLFQRGDDEGRRLLMELARSSATPRGSLSPAQEKGLLSHTEARAQALVRLSDMATEDVVGLMEQTLSDASGAVRDATAVALCRLDLAQAPPVAPFVRHFLDAARDQDAAVRLAAVKALGQANLSSARETLVAAVGDTSSAVRAEAVAALAAVGDESLARLFIERLEDENPRVRSMAAGGLARIAQAPSAVVALRRLADNGKTPDLALRAMAGLAELGEHIDLDLAQRQLRAHDVDGRMLALEAIAAAPGDDAPQLLARVMSKDASLRVRVAAAALLAKRLQRRRP